MPGVLVLPERHVLASWDEAGGAATGTTKWKGSRVHADSADRLSALGCQRKLAAESRLSENRTSDLLRPPAKETTA